MTTRLLLAILLALPWPLHGCASVHDISATETRPLDASEAAPQPTPLTDSQTLAGVAQTPAPRLIIRNAYIEMEVDDLDQALSRLIELTQAAGGYEVRTSRQDGVFRIPAGKLESFLKDALALAKRVVEVQRHAEDVTDQVTDLELRLKNARVAIERLHKLLAEGNRIEELLRVEQEITRLTLEVERLEAQRRNLSERVAYAEARFALRGPDRQASKEIPGPIGFVAKGTWWLVKKLFIIRDGEPLF